VSDRVRAAGGVVTRGTGESREVLLVHRPQYDDWTFPKGKAKPAESDEACATREVEEETTLRCELGRELPPTRYVDAKGRSKIVRWWLMHPVGDPDGAAAANEVGDVRWLAPDAARELLTYRRDLALLDAL
jgi:8-oxo-dGTP pyrophosphatase MutT (NUDIX family)